MFFKKIAIGAIAGVVVMITGCGDSDISKVKNTVLAYDQTRNVETALKARCSSLKWKHFKSDEGKNVVEVIGCWKDDKYASLVKAQEKYMEKSHVALKKFLGLNPKEYIQAQFLISADGKLVMLGYGAFLDTQKKVKTCPNPLFPQSNLIRDTAHELKTEDFLHMMYHGD